MRVCVSRLSLGPANLDKQVFLLSRNVIEESELGLWPGCRETGINALIEGLSVQPTCRDRE